MGGFRLIEHLARGFTANTERLEERGLRRAHETLDRRSRILQNSKLVDDSGQTVLDIITGYAATWHLLRSYDEDQWEYPARRGNPRNQALNDCRTLDVIARFRQDLEG